MDRPGRGVAIARIIPIALMIAALIAATLAGCEDRRTRSRPPMPETPHAVAPVLLFTGAGTSGGDFERIGDGLAADATANIRRAVGGGLNYLGLCAGAFGAGWMILTGVHPEAPASWRRGLAFHTSVEDANAYAATLIHSALDRERLPHY